MSFDYQKQEYVPTMFEVELQRYVQPLIDLLHRNDATAISLSLRQTNPVTESWQLDAVIVPTSLSAGKSLIPVGVYSLGITRQDPSSLP